MATDADNVYLTSGEDSLALHAEPALTHGETRLDHVGVLLDTAGEVDTWAAHLKAAARSFRPSPDSP